MLFIECTDGWYGLNCTQKCDGHCRDDTACNHMTGMCEGECDAGGQEICVIKVMF